MNFMYLLKCFFLGFSAASTIGPIFVLTFNKGAVYGFWRGFATALGAAIGDGLLFLLGLLGVLNLLESSKKLMLIMDLVGGLVLIFLGFHMMLSQEAKKDSKQIEIPSVGPAYLTVFKSFILTVINPLTILFFMFMGIQILPQEDMFLSINQVFTSGLMVASGSLSMLSLVSLCASLLGSVINPRTIKIVSYITGIIFIAIGVYFLGDFVMVIGKK